MNPTPWIAAALLAPLVAAQQSAQPGAAQAAPAVAASAAADYETLRALRAASPAAARAVLDASMAQLAEAGDAHALAWCLRRPDAFGEARTARAVDGFPRLVREHAADPWLRRPELDPVVALAHLERPTCHAVAAALAQESFAGPRARALALLLRATALAPRKERDAPRTAEALACLAELRALDPEGPWTRRADDLAWRLEHLTPGAPAPELVLRDVDGNELVLEDWLDGDVLVDVWRADDPDRAERTAELAALVERVRAARPERHLRVLALGLGADAASFRRELEELDLPWPTAFEVAAGGPARNAWRLDGGPTRLWIDAEGRLRTHGGTTAELEALLLEPPPVRDVLPAGTPRDAPDQEVPEPTARAPREGEAR